MANGRGDVIGVAGAGAWGTALALVAARVGRRVRLWARGSARVEALAATLPEAIAVTSDLGRLRGLDTLLLVVPAQAVRETCRGLGSHAGRVVICAKGLERATGLRLMAGILSDKPRVEAKIRLYERKLPKAGAVFCFDPLTQVSTAVLVMH